MKSHQKETNGAAGEALSELKEAGKELLEEASDLIKKKTSQLRNKGLSESVKENPVKSVLIALGVGIVLGFLLKPRD